MDGRAGGAEAGKVAPGMAARDSVMRCVAANPEKTSPMLPNHFYRFDVIVIGGGHAGTEAAPAIRPRRRWP